MKNYKVSTYDGVKVTHVEVKAVSGGMAVEQVLAPLRKVKGMTVLDCKRVKPEKKTEPSNGMEHLDLDWIEEKYMKSLNGCAKSIIGPIWEQAANTNMSLSVELLKGGEK